MPTVQPLVRRALVAVVVAGIAIGSAACQPVSPSSAPAGSSEASQLVALVNNYRAANGLAPLSIAGDAMAKAQQHANDMAAQGRMFHSGSLSSDVQPGWSALGENVGGGATVDQLEAMFEQSSSHRANLLSGAYTQIGIGTARAADGTLFVDQFFVGR
jgi:uncharacterized protein YkwD